MMEGGVQAQGWEGRPGQLRAPHPRRDQDQTQDEGQGSRGTGTGRRLPGPGERELPVFAVQWALLPGAQDSLHIFMPRYVVSESLSSKPSLCLPPSI